MAPRVALWVFVAGRENLLEVLIAKNLHLRRLLWQLRWFERFGRILRNPAGLLAEREERPQPLEVLVGRERTVLPGRAEFAQGVHVELFQQPETFVRAPG